MLGPASTRSGVGTSMSVVVARRTSLPSGCMWIVRYVIEGFGRLAAGADAGAAPAAQSMSAAIAQAKVRPRASPLPARSPRSTARSDHHRRPKSMRWAVWDSNPEPRG